MSQLVTCDNCDVGVAELNRVVKSNISELKSSSETWLEVLTNKVTHMLILSVLELQSSLDPQLDTEVLGFEFQLGPLSSRTQIFSPLMSVI